ncbi:hypothetical protein LWI28_008392 [Acer negundo]|uniref:Uncharacterized protein n=1 Tax=Acer negundo TaxID=4023 RepID=A0AAD5P422_ACENE|nr:hypothetical protein LWI28_008392 [Acer negundo]
MPPKRSANLNPRENPIDEVYERYVIAQLWQQVQTLTQQIVELTAQKWRPNPQEADEESNHSLFFNYDYVSKSVIVDFDMPPIFDEEISDDDFESSETVVSDEYSSQGLSSFHHELGLFHFVVMPPKRRVNLNPYKNPIDEVYERDLIARLRQQVETLTQQIAALTAQK